MKLQTVCLITLVPALMALGLYQTVPTPTPVLVVPPHISIMANNLPAVATVGDYLNVTSFMSGGSTYYQLNSLPPYSRTNYFTVTAWNQIVFNLSGQPTAGVRVFRNGLRMTPGLDYSQGPNQVIFVGKQIPLTGDVVVIDY